MEIERKLIEVFTAMGYESERARAIKELRAKGVTIRFCGPSMKEPGHFLMTGWRPARKREAQPC